MQAAILLLSVLEACGDQSHEPTHDLVVGCDGTGRSPGDVCTVDFLQGAFLSWSRTGDVRWTRGASLSVVYSAEGYGSTTRVEVSVPPRWLDPGHPGRWEREGLQLLAGHAIPGDDLAGKGKQPNRSDLLALVAVAMREARGALRPVDLVVASDGWFISLGFNADTGPVPPVAEVREAMSSAGFTWDPAVFASVTFCGLTTTGQTAAKVAARDALLADLLSAEGRPAPRLLSSCAAPYPPVPPQLPPAPVGADSDSNSSSSR